MNAAAINSPALPQQRPQPGRRAAAVLAAVVHLLLALILIYGVTWQSKRPEVVEVELYRHAPSPTPAPLALTPPPPLTVPEVIEPRPLPADIAMKAPKEKELPNNTVQKPELTKPNPRQESMNNAMLKALQQEDEVLNKKRQEMQDRAVKNALEASYIDRVRSKIRSNIVLPPGLQGNPEAIFDVVQLPSADVLNVRLVKSSGNSALDDAIERAIRKSSPLPKPENAAPARDLRLTFKPLDS